jgi:hypothetical protein
MVRAPPSPSTPRSTPPPSGCAGATTSASPRSCASRISRPTTGSCCWTCARRVRVDLGRHPRSPAHPMLTEILQLVARLADQATERKGSVRPSAPSRQTPGASAWELAAELAPRSPGTCIRCPYRLGTNLRCPLCRAWLLAPQARARRFAASPRSINLLREHTELRKLGWSILRTLAQVIVDSHEEPARAAHRPILPRSSSATSSLAGAAQAPALGDGRVFLDIAEAEPLDPRSRSAPPGRPPGRDRPRSWPVRDMRDRARRSRRAWHRLPPLRRRRDERHGQGAPPMTPAAQAFEKFLPFWRASLPPEHPARRTSTPSWCACGRRSRRSSATGSSGARRGATSRLAPDAATKASRTRNNLEAMRIVATRRPQDMSADERRAVLGYSGWGGLSIEAVMDQFPPGLVPTTSPDPRVLHADPRRRGHRGSRVPVARRSRRLRRRRAGLRAQRRHRPPCPRDGPAALPGHRPALQGDPLDRGGAVRRQRQDVRGDAPRCRAVLDVARAMDE